MSTKAEISSQDIVQENTTTMNTPVVSIPPFKEEENPYSPDLDTIPLDEEMFPSLEVPDIPMEQANPVPSTSNIDAKLHHLGRRVLSTGTPST